MLSYDVQALGSRDAPCQKIFDVRAWLLEYLSSSYSSDFCMLDVDVNRLVVSR